MPNLGDHAIKTMPYISGPASFGNTRHGNTGRSSSPQPDASLKVSCWFADNKMGQKRLPHYIMRTIDLQHLPESAFHDKFSMSALRTLGKYMFNHSKTSTKCLLGMGPRSISSSDAVEMSGTRKTFPVVASF